MVVAALEAAVGSAAAAAVSAAEGRRVAGDRQGSRWQKLQRVWRHRLASDRQVRAVFNDAAFRRIESAIAAGETLHRGEVRFAVEAELDLYRLWAGMTPRERALQVFSEQGIWDTEENTGVLIYLLWADHAVEIIADRTASRCLPPARWLALCESMAQACRENRHVEGVVTAIGDVNQALQAALPATAQDADELPNR
ncbi:MAG TPA: TPM domain-containing protein, partial [Lautropia sp.]|nr:TPM domain-containing protein [Lautropia sp.]